MCIRSIVRDQLYVLPIVFVLPEFRKTSDRKQLADNNFSKILGENSSKATRQNAPVEKSSQVQKIVSAKYSG